MKTGVLRKLTAFCLCFAVLCACICNTKVVNADNLNPTTIRVKMLYDESYAYFFAENGIEDIADIESRLLQLGEIIEVPYKTKLNINLEFSVQSYESLFGPTYAAQYGEGCLWEYTDAGKMAKSWHYDQDCECEGIPCYDSNTGIGHHTNANRYLNIMNNYLNENEDADFDVLALYVGHRMCYGNTSSHGRCGGLAFRPGKVLAMQGFDCFWGSSFDAMQAENLDQCKQYFWHEFGHSFNLGHGSSDIHNANVPCCEASGMDGITYAEDIWCGNCEDKINYSHLVYSPDNNEAAVAEFSGEYCVSEPVSSMFFNTFEEYNNYMNANGEYAVQTISTQTEDILPEFTPADAELVGIELSDDGTTVTYSVAQRNVPLSVGEDDFYLRGLLSFYREKEFNKAVPVISDHMDFVENLAEAIKATSVIRTADSINNIGYMGSVYAGIRLDDGTVVRTEVGRQLVYVNTSGFAAYHYFPITVSMAEIQQICGLNGCQFVPIATE